MEIPPFFLTRRYGDTGEQDQQNEEVRRQGTSGNKDAAAQKLIGSSHLNARFVMLWRESQA
jgi:hypothetical protein